MKVNDNVKVIMLEDEDNGYGIEVGTTGVILKEDIYNNAYDIEDIFHVKLNCEIVGNPTNLNKDGTYQLYRRQLEVI